MKMFVAQIAQFAADDQAGAAIEFGILATAIALAIVQVVGQNQNGAHLGGFLQRVVAEINGG